MSSADLFAITDVRRDQWDPDDDDRGRPAERTWSQILYGEVHHLGDDRVHPPGTTQAELRKAERYHEDSKGWRDLFYQVPIDIHDGTIYEGRHHLIPSQKSGRPDSSPIPDDDLVDTLTILAVGDGNRDVFSDAFWRSVIRVWRLLPDNPLRYHSLRQSTACPSNQARARIHAINAGTDPLMKETPMPDANGNRLLSDHADLPDWAKGAAERFANEYRYANPNKAGKMEALLGLDRPAEWFLTAEVTMVLLDRIVIMLRGEMAKQLGGTPGPAGPKGERGATGPRGPAGTDGLPGSPADLDALATDVVDTLLARVRGQ